MKALMLLIAANLAPDTLSNYEQLLFKAQYTELEYQILQQDDYKEHGDVLAIYARALFNQQRLEDANTLLNFAVEQFPTHSELHYLAGLCKIKLASDGNIFAAKDRALRGVALLQKAIALKPDHFPARQALIDFYSVAPAAAGGDKELARQQADLMAEINPAQAALALSRILLNEKKPDEAIAILNKYLTDPPNPLLLARKAQLLNDNQQYGEAFATYRLTAKYAVELGNKYNALYHIGRLAVIADQDVDIGIEALEDYLEFYKNSENPSVKWATLRLAQLMYRTSQLEEASKLAASLTSVEQDDEEFNLILLSLLSALRPAETKTEAEQAQHDIKPSEQPVEAQK